MELEEGADNKTVESPSKATEAIDNDIEVRQARVYEVKQALARQFGLEGQAS